MAIEQPKNEQIFWRQRWQEGSTGWDLGGVHPGLMEAMNLVQNIHLEDHTQAAFQEEAGARPRIRKAYVPGCGRAHDVAWLAQFKSTSDELVWQQVVGADFAPEAIQDASALYGKVQGVSLRCEDVTVVPSEDRGAFDLVFDRAMLCALKPELRPAYMKAVVERLAPRGVHLVFLFDRIKPRYEGENPRESGPPFEIDLKLYDDLVRPLGLDVRGQKSWMTRWPSGREMSELMIVACKKTAFA